MQRSFSFVVFSFGMVVSAALAAPQIVAPTAFVSDQFGATVTATPDGIAIAATDPGLPPIATASGLGLEIGSDQWLVVRLKANKGEYAALWSSEHSGPWKNGQLKLEDQFAFPIRADGEFHTYNVWLGDYRLFPLKPGREYDVKIGRKFRLFRSSLTGRIDQLAILPTCEPGADGAVASFGLADKPDGSPPVLVIEYVGDAVGLNRPGKPGTIAVRVRNAGGSAATGFVPVFAGDPALRFDPATLREVPATLAPDKVATFYIDLAPAAAGRFPFTLDLACAEGDHARATNTYKVEPALAVMPPRGEIPAPRRLKTDYDIGCWYYPGWDDLTHWPAVTFAAERTPLLGTYDEKSPLVADWSIKWAAEHGINYFMVLWYVTEDPNDFHHHNRFFTESYMKSRFRSDIDFCVAWCTDGDPKRSSEAHLLANFDYWLKNFFPLPEYRKTDGRPWCCIYSGHTLFRYLGRERVKAVLAECDRRARAAGFPGVHWIGGYTENAGDDFLAAGIDAQAYYNWEGTRRGFAGATPAGLFPVVPAATHYEEAAATWRVMERYPKLEILLPVVPGFDDRVWAGGKNPRTRYGNNPGLFRRHLLDAKAWLDAHKSKSMLIEAWSEWGEGGIIGPHAQFGFDYLDAITDVFAPGQPVAPHIGPDDVDVHVPSVPHLYDWIDFVPARPPQPSAPDVARAR